MRREDLADRIAEGLVLIGCEVRSKGTAVVMGEELILSEWHVAGHGLTEQAFGVLAKYIWKRSEQS